MLVLSIDGLQLPVTPSSEVEGKGIMVSPLHIAGIWTNVGVTIGLTVIVMVWVNTHCSASGVNVYVVVVVLSNAGLQLPVIPSLDVMGKGDKVSPLHIGGIWVNVGVTIGLTVIVIV